MPRITLTQLLNIFLIVLLNVLNGLVPYNSVEYGEKIEYINLLVPESIPLLSNISFKETSNITYGPQIKGIVTDQIIVGSDTTESEKNIKDLQISAESYLILDVGSSSILIEKNSRLPLYPASSIKMMTALVARDLYNLDDEVTIDERSLTEGHIIGLRLGEKLTVRKLLMGMLISSGNDSALALAAYHPDGVEKFVEKMNDKAAELNLTNSYFHNPAGLDSTWQRSTARDLAIMARELIKDPFFKELIAIEEVVVTDEQGKISHKFINTNALLGKMAGVKGVKTGTTPLAGQVLVTLVDRSNHSYIIVLMNSKQRYNDTRQLIKYIDESYSWVDYELP